METNVPENCPRCSVVTPPNQIEVEIEKANAIFLYVLMWRYWCECGYTWTNYDQRTHNYHAWKQALKSK